ncbi:hypothetical protein ACH5A2_19675 [Streptomyces collinus]|uniref:hypothetical protein n=1 Tax=Streptomyces collinus TaxID=42684 RepID=UPI0037A40D25
MIADAIDTAVTLGWAFLGWLALLSLATGVALYAAVVIAWCTLRGVWCAGRALWHNLSRPARPDYDKAA